MPQKCNRSKKINSIIHGLHHLKLMQHILSNLFLKLLRGDLPKDIYLTGDVPAKPVNRTLTG